MHTQSNTQRERLQKLKAQEAKLRHHLSNNLEKRMFEINQLLVSGDGSSSHRKDTQQALERARLNLAKCDTDGEAAKQETATLTTQINELHDKQRVSQRGA